MRQFSILLFMVCALASFYIGSLEAWDFEENEKGDCYCAVRNSSLPDDPVVFERSTHAVFVCNQTGQLFCIRLCKALAVMNKHADEILCRGVEDDDISVLVTRPHLYSKLCQQYNFTGVAQTDRTTCCKHHLPVPCEEFWAFDF